MLHVRKLGLGLSILGISLLANPQASAHIFDGSTISAVQNPTTSVDQVEILVTAIGPCPIFGPITVEADNTVLVDLRTDCPFTIPPVPGDPVDLMATVGPLEVGIYELRLVEDDGTLLDSETLEVLPEGSCLPSATVLCLRDHRFQVEVAFETPAGDTGNALASELTDDSGTFTFFNQNNVELIVKALDGCSSSFNSYWFFAAGLTNVEVEISVTDLMSGQTKTYLNPIRTPFEPILDTSAFETCP